MKKSKSSEATNATKTRKATPVAPASLRPGGRARMKHPRGSEGGWVYGDVMNGYVLWDHGEPLDRTKLPDPRVQPGGQVPNASSAMPAAGPAQIAAAVAGRVAAYVAAQGVNESGELPAGWAASIASDLDLPCDERLVQYADEAYTAAASR